MGYDKERLLGPASIEEPMPHTEPVPLQSVAGAPQVPDMAPAMDLEAQSMHIPTAQGVVQTPTQFQGAAVSQVSVVPEHIVHGQWERPFCDCCSTTAGCNAFWMAAFWPVCGPCLFAKIASRVRWVGWQKLGETPFQQWMRSGLILITVYWFFCFNYWVFSALGAAQMMQDREAYGVRPGSGWDFNKPLSKRAEWLMETVQFFDIGNTLISIVLFVIIVILRGKVRAQFLIPAACDARGGPATACGACEDVCIVCCCTTCAIAQVAQHVHATNEGCQPFQDPGPADLLAQGYSYPNEAGGSNIRVVTHGTPPQALATNYMYGAQQGVTQGQVVDAELEAGAPVPRATLASEEPGAPPPKV
mmetsp:Transcript_8225/g.20077  ORF Transcript_8225/g.20077 Transcript_8225/m.20077 type:complete len:360 (+) Transcript_8225:61-1140(+)